MDEHSEHSDTPDNNLLIVYLGANEDFAACRRCVISWCEGREVEMPLKMDALRLYGSQGAEALTNLEDRERSYLQNLALTLKGATESYPIREQLEEQLHRYHELCSRNQAILEAMENETKRTTRDKFGKFRDVKYKKAFRRSKKLCDRQAPAGNTDKNIQGAKEDVMSGSGTSINLTTSMEDCPLLKDSS